jgi:hypothetical protein
LFDQLSVGGEAVAGEDHGAGSNVFHSLSLQPGACNSTVIRGDKARTGDAAEKPGSWLARQRTHERVF